ncbi:MAG: ABC transporter, partial [Propionicimonas sp.]
SFAEAVRTVAVQTADGTLLRGEVLARWHDFVGTGEFFRAVEQRIGWLRDRFVAVVRGEPKEAIEVKVAVEAGLEALIREEGEAAARRVESAWQAHPAGRQLLATTGDDLARASSDFPRAAADAVRAWQGDVLEVVQSEGASKRSTARFWALGVNGVGVALMILVFSQTGGLVGAEIGVAGATALLAQRVLEAVFGEDAVRRLAKRAKADLDARVEAVMATELTRYLAALDAVDPRPDQATELRSALAEVEAARAADDRQDAHLPLDRLSP